MRTHPKAFICYAKTDRQKAREVFDYLSAEGADISGGDAAHVATTVVHECDHLMMWNLRHIANARIRRSVERIIESYGHRRTTICTPEELF